MTNEETLEPILKQIEYWLAYLRAKLKAGADTASLKEYEMDFNLTGGNTKADMLLSLYIPFRRVLTNLHSGLPNAKKSIYFLEFIKKSPYKYLPPENPLVQELSELFALGRTRANVIILPDARINNLRGDGPYWDYVPHFLYQCFGDGAFSGYFKSEEDLRKWIERENLQMFFNGDVTRDNIKDLIGSGSVTSNLTPDLSDVSRMITSYIAVLKLRSEFYPEP